MKDIHTYIQKIKLLKNQVIFFKRVGSRVFANRSGFSIVGVLIAASVGIIVVLGLTRSQVYLLKNTQKIELKMKALELTKEIISTLEAPAPDCVPPCTWSRSSCTNTLEGFNDVAGTETVKTDILSATHQTNQPTASTVYSTSTDYNGVQIKEMKVVSENTGDDIVILRVWFETDEDIEQGTVSPEMARPFDIYAKVNYVAGSNTVESCTAVITSYSTFSGKTCASGEYLKGFDNIGIMKCVPLPNCGDNEYLKGFDNSGNKICKTLLKVYKKETRNLSSVNRYALDQSEDKVYCDVGDIAISGGGMCARCDTSGVHPACSLLGGQDPQAGYLIKSGNKEGYHYYCDYNNNGTSDTAYTYVVCLDSSPPYRP